MKLLPENLFRFACRRALSLLTAASLLIVSSGLAAPASSNLRAAPDQRTALDKYVAAPDTNYTYSLASTIPGEG